MGDYRQWSTCKVCGIGEINSFGGGCDTCDRISHDSYVRDFVETFRVSPETAIASLASAIYNLKKRR